MRCSVPTLGFVLLLGLGGGACPAPSDAPGVAVPQTASTAEPPRSADPSFRPEVVDPAFPAGAGPTVILDEAHENFHTMDGTYRPFTDLLVADGYRVQRGTARISRALLGSCRIYVVADAQPPRRAGASPTFAGAEIALLTDWVRKGGSLLLITDHMPDPSAIEELAASFGIRVHDGYVLNGYLEGREEPLVFGRADGTLREHAVIEGLDASGRVDQVATFAGSAFLADPPFQPLLVFGEGRRSWTPEKYWEFPPGTPSIDVSGWYQGGLLEFDQGRVAVFSEAAMFTAQIFDEGRIKAGMNHPLARDNARLLLNVMRWLAE